MEVEVSTAVRPVWSADDIKALEEPRRTKKKKRVPRVRDGEGTLRRTAPEAGTGAKLRKGEEEKEAKIGKEHEAKGPSSKKNDHNEQKEVRRQVNSKGKEKMESHESLESTNSEVLESPSQPRKGALGGSAPEKDNVRPGKERKGRSVSDGSDDDKASRGKVKEKISAGSPKSSKKMEPIPTSPPSSPPLSDTGRRATISSSSPPSTWTNAKEATPSASSAAIALARKQREKGALSDVVTTQEVMEATFSQDLKKLEYLWTRGASIDCHDETNGYTPLHWAIVNDKSRSVSWLLEHEAKVNAKDSMGWTPLHYAVHSSKADVIRALLERNASPSVKNNKGKLPVDLAKSRAIVKMLKEAKDKEKGPSRLSWFGFKGTEGVSNSADLIKKEGTKSVGNGTLRKPVSPRSAAAEEEEESEERKKKRADLDQRERDLDELREGLTLKEKELYLKEQELNETEQRLNSKEGWVAMREQELLKLEKRVDKRKEKLVNRERALVGAEERHRVAAISAAVRVIGWDELQLGELLGSGGFADVYKAAWHGDYVAVKVIKNQRDDDTFRLQFQQESLFLSKLRHYHVVQLMGVCVEYPHMSIVMELMTNDTLSHLLKATRRGEAKIPAPLMLQLAREIARGMNFLHTMDPPLIHRDLKPANILLDEHLRAKIGDVGFVQTKDEDLREGAQEGFAGTPAYMAPECLRQEPYDQKCDVYSYGNVLWELLTLKKPWKGKKQMEIVALAGYNRDKLPMPSPHSLPEGIPASLLEIIARCWADVPSDRPSFARLLTLLPSATSS